MMKKTLAVILGIVLVAGAAAAVEASIQPSDPDDITMDGSNSYEVSKQFSGTASTGSITSYTWDLVGTSQSATGPQATFTFDRDSASSNTIRLTVSNGTHSDVDEVTQVLHDDPNISISPSSKQSIDEGGSVSFSSTVTNSFDSPVSYSWSVDGSEENTSASFDRTFSSSGTFTVNLTVTDNAGNTDSAAVDVEASSSDDSEDNDDSGGGGGGGGGGAASSSSAAASKSKLWFNIEAGANVSMQVADSGELGVKNISINVRNPAQNVEVTVSKQDGKPADVDVNVSGTAYRYMDIGVSNLDDNDIDNATIEFDVNTSWIQDNSINRSTIALHRFNETWQRLKTTEIAESSDTVTFEAVSPGFSYFAVAAEETQQTQDQPDETETQPDNQAQQDDLATTTNQTGQDQSGQQDDAGSQAVDTGQEPDTGYGTWLTIGIITLVVILLIGGAVMWHPRFNPDDGEPEIQPDRESIEFSQD